MHLAAVISENERAADTALRSRETARGGFIPSSIRFRSRPRRTACIAITGAQPPVIHHPDSASLGNVRLMRLLRRLAGAFNEASVPVMILKGAVLNLLIHDRPDERPMDDVDLLVRPEQAQKAQEILEDMGALRGRPLVREDFFPRFHYETDYRVGRLSPVKIDLHVRPFRPLRLASLLPDDAFWEDAISVPVGPAQVLVPSPRDMLIHLAAHAAFHGCNRMTWLADLKRWVGRFGSRIDWSDFVGRCSSLRLALPVCVALTKAERELGKFLPETVLPDLDRSPVNWRDRLALWHAPRDIDDGAGHIVVDVLCTPGLRFVAGYLKCVLCPSRQHMAGQYAGRHTGWVACAHLVRWLGPVLAPLGLLARRRRRIELRDSPTHGTGVFAVRNFKSGDVITRFHRKPGRRPGPYVLTQRNEQGRIVMHEITGPLRFLNHDCRPNAKFDGSRLVAMRSIPAGQELKVDYGPDACNCRQNEWTGPMPGEPCDRSTGDAGRDRP